MEFPDLAQAQQKLIDFFSKEKKISPSEIRVIARLDRLKQQPDQTAADNDQRNDDTKIAAAYGDYAREPVHYCSSPR